ncbi:helix-turn-helix transcriptional regulator [Shouchella patagoniensis]|uniref:helix-turn-helix transcriptional regulator n=1 Tax=Shouchella patagoniensis TaxID=228576 RepID=UPI000994F805|nr:YafY family protein [Shouchella patagoniensis]
MSIHRHFEIIYLLLKQKVITAKELSEHFEVSTRTIYRDMDVLSGAGIPIFATKGKGGGISLMEGYSLNTSLLTNSDQENILIGLQTISATDMPSSHKVLEKLATQFKKGLINWIEVDFSPWGSGKETKQLFSFLQDAIIHRYIVTFSYYNNEGEKSNRSVQPYQLLFKKNAWYLWAYCLVKDDLRIFKMNRMRAVHVTDNHFEPDPSVSLKPKFDYTKATTLAVTLRISSRGAYRVYDEFADEMITTNEDGSYTIHAHFPASSWLEDYLLSFGTLLEEVHPEQLRTNMIAKIDQLKHHLESNET